MDLLLVLRTVLQTLGMQDLQPVESSTVLADAVSLNPTFFSLWIGNNDIIRICYLWGYLVLIKQEIRSIALMVVMILQILMYLQRHTVLK